jgi:hypothetical protein
MIRPIALIANLFLLAGCVAQLPWAPEARITRAAYSHPGPKSITLISVAANGSKSVGHSALLINASQRVLYDPAGTWYNPDVPERADLLYGITPTYLQYYIDYHARDRFHVVMQTIDVPAAVAETVMRLAIEAGASMNGMCANNTSSILSRTPGFQGFPVSVWPRSAVEAMARLPGVRTERIYQTDTGKDLKGVVNHPT